MKITEAEKEEASKKTIPPGYRFKFSEYRSAFQSFSVDEKGRVFVQTWERSTEPEGASVFDVFNEKGEEIGRFPVDMTPGVWKNGKLYVLVTARSGDQKVTRYAVEWEDSQPISP